MRARPTLLQQKQKIGLAFFEEFTFLCEDEMDELDDARDGSTINYVHRRGIDLSDTPVEPSEHLLRSFIDGDHSSLRLAHRFDLVDRIDIVLMIAEEMNSNPTRQTITKSRLYNPVMPFEILYRLASHLTAVDVTEEEYDAITV